MSLFLLVLLGACLSCSPSAFGQSRTDSLLQSPAIATTPFESLIRFARIHDIPVTRVDPVQQNAQPQKGDRITMLVTMLQGSSSQQWLTVVTQDTLTAKETHLKPLPETVLYTSTGRQMIFKNTRTALSVRFLGPFTRNGAPADADASSELPTPHRTLVSSEQLNFSLDRFGRAATALAERCDAAGVKMSELYHIASPNPLSNDQLENGKRFVNLIHPTEEEERTVVSVSLALNAFLSASLEIDEFSDVVDKVLEKPSLWGIVTSFGVRRFLRYDVSTVRPVDASYLGVSMPAYSMPLRVLINDNVALQAVITMTAARPPLQTCAGIIEVYAEHPVDRGKRLLIQLLAGRR